MYRLAAFTFEGYDTLPVTLQANIMSYLQPVDGISVSITKNSMKSLQFEIETEANTIRSRGILSSQDIRRLDLDTLCDYLSRFSSYDRFIYVMTIRPDRRENHDLSKESRVKNRNRGMLSLIDIVSHVAIIVMGSRGCYDTPLRDKPHGEGMIATQLSVLLRHGIDMNIQIDLALPGVDTSQGLGGELSVHQDPFRSMNALPLMRFIPFQSHLINFMLENVQQSNDVRVNASRSFDIGFGTFPQTSTHPANQDHFRGKLLPCFKLEGKRILDIMPIALRDALADLLMHFQNQLGGGFNGLRSSIVSPIMMRRAFPNHPSIKFEYINIIVKPEGGPPLKNHMDYMNDPRRLYSHCPVYWFVQRVNGVNYRVAMVMTFRNVIGNVVDNH